MRLPRNAKIFRGRLDAAPFVGVFFILLLFVVLHTSLVYFPGVAIELPDSAKLPGPSGPTIVVAVDSRGALFFENQVVRKSEIGVRLKDRLKSMKGPVTLVIQADKSVSYETLQDLAERAQEAGIEKAVLAARPNRFIPQYRDPNQP